MKVISNIHCTIGEGPIWNDFDGKLYQVNGFENQILVIDLSSGEVTVRQLDFSVAAMGFSKKEEMLISCLDGVYIFYVYGLMHTSISNAGFICALPAVTTPVLQFFITGKKPGPRLTVSLVLCTVGLALLTLNEAFRPALGDVICMGVALFYALDLIYTEKAVSRPEVDPLQMGVLELGVVGVIMLVLCLFLEQPRLPSTPLFWGSALFLALFCTGFAFVVQTVQQQYTTASHVGLIFTLEPLFSAIVAYFFAHEVLGLRGYIGAALMMLSLVLMEVDVGAWLKTKLTKKA
jgi:drug/metabolite transporter (DMT)-like permease